MTNKLELAKKIYETFEKPDVMKEAEPIALPKREGTTECEKRRTLSKMSQVANIVLNVIGQRLKGKVEEYVDE